MAINFIIPFTPDKQLAAHYNEQANRFDDDDWICFVDADAMFLDPYFGQHLEKIVENHGDEFLAFTCMTNRVGNLKQCHQRKMSSNFDLMHHLKIAEARKKEYFGTVLDFRPSPPMSGVMILSKVSTIKKIPFRGAGMLGVDNNFHQDISAKGKFGLILGVYLFHKYRAGNIKNKTHMK